MGRGGYDASSSAVSQSISDECGHDLEHGGGDPAPYQNGHSICPKCGSVFEMRSQFLRHLREGCVCEIQPEVPCPWNSECGNWPEGRRSSRRSSTTFEEDAAASRSQTPQIASEPAPGLIIGGDVVISIEDTPDQGSEPSRNVSMDNTRRSSNLARQPGSNQDARNDPPRGRSRFKSFPNGDSEKQNGAELQAHKDDLPNAYLSLIAKYGRRRNQGQDSQYARFANAMLRQNEADEHRCRASVIEFYGNRSKEINFRDSKELEHYLCSNSGPEETPKPRSRRRLFVMEDLSRRHVCLLGSHLRINPSVFANHHDFESVSAHTSALRAFPSTGQPNSTDGVWHASFTGRSQPMDNGRRRFAIKYPVVISRLSDPQELGTEVHPGWIRSRANVQEFNVDRTTETTEVNGLWDQAKKSTRINSQATYWSRSSGSNWDAMILVDPCVQDPGLLEMLSRRAGSPELQAATHDTDLDDELDIPADPVQWTTQPSWSKFILYDDILQHFALSEDDPGSAPLAVTQCIRGFAINKWVVYLNDAHSAYLGLCNRLYASDCAITGQGPQHSSELGGILEEWTFKRIIYLITDLFLCRTDLECNMRELGMDPEDAQSYGVVGKREAQMWRYIRDRLKSTEDNYKDLSEMYMQLSSLRESQSSNYLNRSVGRLTLLGTCFVPASLIASMLSMGGDFLPGARDFWVFWVVTVPVLGLTSILLFTAWPQKCWRAGKEKIDEKKKEEWPRLRHLRERVEKHRWRQVR